MLPRLKSCFGGLKGGTTRPGVSVYFGDSPHIYLLRVVIGEEDLRRRMPCCLELRDALLYQEEEMKPITKQEGQLFSVLLSQEALHTDEN